MGPTPQALHSCPVPNQAGFGLGRMLMPATPCRNRPAEVNQLGGCEQDPLVRESAHDHPPLLIRELGIDAVEEVDFGVERRLREQIVANRLNLREKRLQPRKRRWGIFAEHQTTGRIEAMQPEFERSPANAVGGKRLQLAFAQPRVDLRCASSDVLALVGSALPRCPSLG